MCKVSKVSDEDLDLLYLSCLPPHLPQSPQPFTDLILTVTRLTRFLSLLSLLSLLALLALLALFAIGLDLARRARLACSELLGAPSHHMAPPLVLETLRAHLPPLRLACQLAVLVEERGHILGELLVPVDHQ
eukprot:scaffold79840_cov63-Phaeocystis_antarctica.AAC.1